MRHSSQLRGSNRRPYLHYFARSTSLHGQPECVAFYGASSPSPQKIYSRPITLEARSWQTSSGPISCFIARPAMIVQRGPQRPDAHSLPSDLKGRPQLKPSKTGTVQSRSRQDAKERSMRLGNEAVETQRYSCSIAAKHLPCLAEMPARTAPATPAA